MTTLRYRAQRTRIGPLECVLIEPEEATNVEGLAVFCHGFGANADDLASLAAEFLNCTGGERPLAFLFPEAPLTLADQGMPHGRAWWLLSVQKLLDALEEGRYEQLRESVPEGIETARDLLVETIEAGLERYELTESNLLLGGFSQGAMLSVEAACLGLKNPPNAITLFSGALICEKRWKPIAGRLSGTSIFQSHGSMDTILPLQTGLWLRDMLQAAGCTVEFHQFAGPHTIPMAAIESTATLLLQLK